MERFARLAALLLATSAAAVPSPEHRSRYQQETIVYKWIVSEEWRYDLLSNRYYVHLIPVLVEDYREPYKPTPKGGEVPRGKER